MDTIPLRANCAQCDALCCVALAFDRSNLFAFDKPAGVPCRNLTACGECAIHARLSASGFAGCEGYDCLGAGQRVAQEIFPGRSWREGEETARAMFEAFSILRRVHELILLLREAAKFPLPPQQRAQHADLFGALQPPTWSHASLMAFNRSKLEADARRFLSNLRDCVRA